MSWYRNKRVLVTGGAGFIGSHIVRALIQEQAHVVILDDLSSGNRTVLNEFLPFITFIEGDIRNEHLCLEATRQCEIIFHCAAFISVPLSMQHPELCCDINIRGTENLLRAAHANGVRSFVFSSSAAVYGNQEKPCIETMSCRVTSPYASSKIEGEKLCKNYASYFSTAILRYFNVYDLDPLHQNPHSVVSRFYKQIVNQEPLEMYGSGLQQRDFIHVAEVAHANLLAGKNECKGDLFNIASGTSITLFDLIKELSILLTPPRLTLLFKPEREGDIKNSQADCSKYQQFASSMQSFHLNLIQQCRGGEIGRHARFRF